MGRYEQEGAVRHPRHVIEHVAYRHRAYRIMGWMSPWVKAGRSLEELALNLRYGNFRRIMEAVRLRLKKMAGKAEYK